MLFSLLTQVCRFFVIPFVLTPFCIVEMAPDNILLYALISALAWGCAVGLFLLSERIDPANQLSSDEDNAPCDLASLSSQETPHAA